MPNDITPTVRIIVELLRSRILDGTYRVGGSLPSELDLASTFQVGRGSVRKAIEALAETGELERVRHSRPLVARAPSGVQRSDKTDVQVWLAQTIRDDSSVPFLQGISRELAGTPYRMVVREPSFYVENVVRADEHQFLVDLLRKPNTAGAIIWRDAFVDHSDVVAQLLNRGLPLVFVDSPAPGGLGADHVGTANVAAAKHCVKHLLSQGHRRIVCVADTDIPPASSDRVKGYWRAMRQAGLVGRCIIPQPSDCSDRWNDPLGGVYAGSLDRNSFFSDLAHRIVMEILGMDPLPTALFVTFDILACWVWAVLEGKGIRVPDQMSIVGFDHRAQWDTGLADELDTAAQDFEGFGRHAVELLLDRISGDVSAVPRHVLLDAPLVIRCSTKSPLPSRPGPEAAVTIRQ